MNLSIPEKIRRDVISGLGKANSRFRKLYPGERTSRQPVHTVYGGADLFRADTAPRMGQAALKHFLRYAPDFTVLARELQLQGFEELPRRHHLITALDKELRVKPESLRRTHPAWIAWNVYHKVIDKLRREPVEDFRIDFEDGFGNRTNAEEDAAAECAALETAKGMQQGTLPPFTGIRIKPFTEEHCERGVRTLDIYLTLLLNQTKSVLPENFVVMLPKVTIPEQVSAVVHLLKELECVHHLTPGDLKMEIMVETTQAVIGADGRNPLMSFVEAGEGRLVATAFGTYDYTASNQITAKYQDMGHPVCDFAHHVMKVALGGTGIFLSDGATNVMPVAKHRGEKLSPEQERENTDAVHNAWRTGYHHIRYSLYKGLYQGWDLHPSQLPIRYAAVYAFFLESYEEAALRLKKFVESSARATLTGLVFDDAATGQGLLNYFLRALNCGAISEKEALATGLSVQALQTRSFVKILQERTTP